MFGGLAKEKSKEQTEGQRFGTAAKAGIKEQRAEERRFGRLEAWMLGR